MTTPNIHQIGRIRSRVDDAANRLAQHLNEPLLIMYYPDEATIEVEDVSILYQHLRHYGLTHDNPLTSISVALHTLGGDPNASYRLAQLLRDFACEVKFIIPEHAYSGGTTITLAGDQIVLAHCAVLSPIDVGLVTAHVESDETPGRDRLEPVAMDHYIDMAANAKVKIESALQEQDVSSAASAADEALMTAMVANPENAMRIATYYRQRNIAETYARQLLANYMLKNAPPARVNKVIDGLVTRAPDHELDMDYHICSDIGLTVSEANQEMSDLSKKLVRELDSATSANIICGRKFNNSHERKPYFHYVHSPNSPITSGGTRQDGEIKPE